MKLTRPLTKLAQRLPKLLSLTLLVLMPLATSSQAAPANQPPPLANAVILIIRHAEKPDSGAGLTPTGEKRAMAYIRYFQSYHINGYQTSNYRANAPLPAPPLHLDRLFAAADTAHSQRPRLTVEPLGKALKLPTDTSFRDKEYAALAHAVESQPSGKAILICWHHGEIPALLTALGADPNALLPQGKWPPQVFDWVIQLRYDQDGHLLPGISRRIPEHLLPGDEKDSQ